MKGYKTLAVNGTALAVATVSVAAGIDWTQFASPQTAVAIGAAANIVLRFLTTTPVGEK